MKMQDINDTEYLTTMNQTAVRLEKLQRKWLKKRISEANRPAMFRSINAFLDNTIPWPIKFYFVRDNSDIAQEDTSLYTMSLNKKAKEFLADERATMYYMDELEEPNTLLEVFKLSSYFSDSRDSDEDADSKSVNLS